jgi:hypothetical protein
MAVRAIESMLLLLQPPRFFLRLSLIEEREVVYGQVSIAQSSVNALNEGVVHWFTGPNKVELVVRRYV